MNRRPILLYATAASLLAVAVAVANAWWLVQWKPAASLVILAFAVQALLAIALIWWVVARAEQRLLRPLRLVSDHLKLLLHTDSDHRLQLPAEHGLGELAERAESIGLALAHSRRDSTRALDSAIEGVERRTARLEAILRDLCEGVVVCSLDHRIVLFNQAAAQTLQAAGPVGLHRVLTQFFHNNVLDEQLQKTLNFYQQHGRSEVRGFRIALAGQKKERFIEVRLALVTEHDRSCSGYVLSFADPERRPLHGSRAVNTSLLAERPEFYDFALFDGVASGQWSQRDLAELSYVVLDTETTGLNPSAGDEIVQLSAVRVVNQRVLTDETFDRLVNPGFAIPPQSIRFHGITDDMVADAPGICPVLEEFAQFCGDSVLVAHNAAFDMKFLKLKESVCSIGFDHAVLDTLLLSIVLQPSYTDHTLDAIAMRFGVHIPAEVRHTALGDAHATAEVFVQMLEALRGEGLATLDRALEASNKVFEIRRQQERF